ncbi:MAG: ferritin-like domain-containing protein [Actinobacteria bacterium]|nr:ferritin-like domain-containing protein [Actinomycetota bacterium]
MEHDDRALATVELLGALTYGQLRAFETTARAVRHAPDARAADRIADHAAQEHRSYVLLRDRLVELTDLGGAVMDRQKPLFDEFFDQAPVDDWVGACTFFGTGLPLAADFIRELAPSLDERTAGVVLDALADRDAFERDAIESIRTIVAGSPERMAEVKRHVADVLGRALTGFQAAAAGTDALAVLLATPAGDDGRDPTKRVVMTVLAGHRRRMHALGIEDLE